MLNMCTLWLCLGWLKICPELSNGCLSGSEMPVSGGVTSHWPLRRPGPTCRPVCSSEQSSCCQPAQHFLTCRLLGCLPSPAPRWAKTPASQVWSIRGTDSAWTSSVPGALVTAANIGDRKSHPHGPSAKHRLNMQNYGHPIQRRGN
ncbi:uncharacterized protein [Eulemur rufifrons]|uniref:uncharacterized protein isoform X3 n=1 Tax=Eulemur rufifrons TaxID=859984 RepID=UPI003743B598